MHITGTGETNFGPWGSDQSSEELLKMLKSKPAIKETPFLKYRHSKENAHNYQFVRQEFIQNLKPTIR